MIDTQKEGKVVRIISDKQFGSIKCEGVDYFFHRYDFNGHWADLELDYLKYGNIPVQFLASTGPRGPRASQVSRIGFPNEAV